MYYKCFELSFLAFFLVAEEERWFMREKWPTYKQQRREGDHIIIFKINSKIFTNTKFNIAYVAALLRPFLQTDNFFCIPIFLLGENWSCQSRGICSKWFPKEYADILCIESSILYIKIILLSLDRLKYYRIEQISQNITRVLDNDEKNHDANTKRFCIMFLNFTPCLFRWKNMIYYFVICILSKRDICWKIKEIFSILVLESLYCQAHRILQGWILTEIKCHSTTIYFVLLVVFLRKQVELFKLWRT